MREGLAKVLNPKMDCDVTVTCRRAHDGFCPLAKTHPMRLFLVSLLLFVAISPLAKADLVISEFCASNQNGLEDEDDDRPDWVEIHNPDSVSADLTNWYLTDNASEKNKWRFPAVTIAPGGYLVVFASGKDRRVAGQPLHTNFSLSADGEFLGLVRPNGSTVVSQYNPSFPAQFPDISYGLPSNISPVTFFTESAPAQWIVPTSATVPGASWIQRNFIPGAGWTSANLGIGFDTNVNDADYNSQIGASGNTRTAMVNAGNRSCAVRIPFSVPAGMSVAGLKLRVKYDDGFIVWLNGQPLLSSGTQVRRNCPASVVWNSQATATQPTNADSLVFTDFDVTESKGLLVTGQNVLAIQAMNVNATSSDFLIRPEFVGDEFAAGDPLPAAYFSTPTPGARNSGSSGVVIPQEVTFSRQSGTFTGSFNLTLGGAISGQQIRYTTDGSNPTASSSLYSGPIPVAASARIRARIVSTTTGALGFIGARHYELIDTTIANYDANGAFRSCLPIVVINNFGGGDTGEAKQDCRVQLYDRDVSGFASLATNSVPIINLRAAVNRRGRSSSNFPKRSWNIEFQDESGSGKDVEVLGMPADEDWALVGCYDFDRAFMRNQWIYEVSRQAGRWAPRTRLVEVVFNQNGNALSFDPANNNANNDYRGVYVLIENIRRGSDRVDVANMEPSETTFPGVSGGFIFKVDQPESDEFQWRTQRNNPAGADALVIHRPKLADLATQQSSYLVNYFQSFENAVYTEASGGFATRSYRNFIDSAAWADHNIFSMVSKNVDALRLSAYYHKDRAGKMAAGPLWDFDRSVNSTDGRDNETNTWHGTGDGTNYFLFAWWSQLFQDIEFRQLYVDRWQKLRDGPLATSNVNSILDGYLAQFRPADTNNPAKRDYARWYGSATSNNITTETAVMKNWLSSRSTWIDSQFATSPGILPAAGPVTAGQTVTFNVPSGSTVFYTLDGSDPRAEGGGTSANALQYTGTPIVVSATTKVTARAQRSGSFAIPATNWSGPVEALYLVDESYASAANLRVSAINYHPLAPDDAEALAMPEAEAGDFEWIELKNVSAGAVNLQNVAFGEGSPASALTLPAFTLAPGARAVVAKNVQAFTLRYGAAAAARIVGTWTGDGGLDNAGEAISVLDRSGAVIAEFNYDDEDDWPERADGDGSALEYVALGSLTSDYENPLNWKSSVAVHGDPGITSAPALSGVVINEILANTATPQGDAIELRNNGPAPVNLGGWFLSHSADPENGEDLKTYRIPDNTMLPAGGYLLIGEAAFSPNGEMSLDGHRGGSLWLVSADPANGKFRNFEDAPEWTPVLPGIAYGRFPDGSGEFTPLASYTPSQVNSAARVGPVQITEIHYHPAGVTPEFVEISNTGSAVEDLGRWTLRGDVDFDFPVGFTIAPAEATVLVAFDPVLNSSQSTSFRNQYGVPAGVRLVGPWSAADTLGNTDGEVRLRRLVPPPEEEPAYVGLMVEDEVNYLASTPWPNTASGTGSSIRRVGVRKWGSDPLAWTAGSPGPGSGVGGYSAWRIATITSPAGEPNEDADRDGLDNFVEYLLGSDPNSFTALSSAIDPNNGSPRFVLNYSVRKDRDDGVLSAFQSGALNQWTPATHDELISTSGATEIRRAWLPLGSRGFLRLEASEVP